MARVLLLETDRQLAKITRDFFTRAGHELVFYSDPQAAVLAADNNPPDVVITDLFLANHSGVEFLYELRSYPEWQKIPVIISGRLPAAELNDFKKSLKQLGVATYVPKQTSTLQDLLAAAEAALTPAAAR